MSFEHWRGANFKFCNFDTSRQSSAFFLRISDQPKDQPDRWTNLLRLSIPEAVIRHTHVDTDTPLRVYFSGLQHILSLPYLDPHALVVRLDHKLVY